MLGLARLVCRCLAPVVALSICAGCEGAPCERGRCIDAGPSRQETWDAAARIVQPDAACAMQSVHALRGKPKPVDIIFVIDNSGSMSDEISEVRRNINNNFAAIIADSGVDYRVIMISLFGPDGTSVCIEPPLGGASCNQGLNATNSAVYFHYNQEIGSTDALCQVLATFHTPDASGRAPDGWRAWLRPEAAKAFVLITDDSANCEYREGDTLVQLGGEGADPYQDALAFHRALLAKSNAQFGAPPDVKYQFFSVVGIAPKGAGGEAVFPYEPLESKTCDTAPSPGLMYQALSVITDALRYPVCEGRSFDAVFHVLARSVIQASKADCVFELPKAPQGQALVLATVNLEYRAGGTAAAQRFGQVDSPANCNDNHSFFIGDHIELCPAACRTVQADSAPEVTVLYGCMVVPD